jgi:ABC-2 type transport system permease protein
MKQFFVITWWEFIRHFKSRSFLLSTFISPLVFAGVILLPTLYLDDPSVNRLKIIGCVEFDTTGICGQIRQRFVELNADSPLQSFIQLVSIRADTSRFMKNHFEQVRRLKFRLDSLDNSYNRIKERRKFIFQKPSGTSRDQELKVTYDELLLKREARDLAEIEYQRSKQETDSLWRIEIVHYADNLLKSSKMEGYLLIDQINFSEGIIEFHSMLPANFLQIDPVKQAIQVVVVENRLKEEGMQVDKIREWLEPLIFREFQLQGEDKQEFNFLINYLGPIIVVLFLFISIFTSSGFLFSGVLKEKSNRVIELLLSSASYTQLVAGKIFGLGLLGIFQIFLWFGLALVLIGVNAFNVSEITFLSFNNAGLFLLYFILGYLFFASIFVGIGTLFSHEEDAHHLNQFMRMLSIFPIILAILVLETPNSPLVRILSFVPPLTPTFMILRIPLGTPPPEDYYISIGIMVISILIGIIVAGRLFKVGSLLYGKRPTFREIVSIAFSRQ